MSNATENFEYAILVCPACREVSQTIEWADCEVGCEDCGDHPAIECPKCGERFDHVWGYDKVEETTLSKP